MRRLIVTALAAASIALAAPATADQLTTDELAMCIDANQSARAYFGTMPCQTMTLVAKQWCDARDQGVDSKTATNVLGDFFERHGGYSRYLTGIAIGSFVMMYCPEYAPNPDS